MANQQEVATFYDDYIPRQSRVGINLRHIRIVQFLKAHGLRPNHHVLEIGCGIGTCTELIAKYVTKGTILGTDISPKSIEVARDFFAKNANVSFVVTDMTDFVADKKFDVIVLPDVLEHIPIENHFELFKAFRACIKPDGFVLIHLPNPRFLEWMHQYEPEKLQVIDQPIHLDILVPNVYPNDFYIDTIKTYSVFYHQPDYQLIVLRPNQAIVQTNKPAKWKTKLQTMWMKLFV